MSNDLELYKVQDMIRQLERLNNSCTDNMKRLNLMMLELKGLVAMVRPQVKKTGWYGAELDTNALRDCVHVDDIKQIELNTDK